MPRTNTNAQTLLVPEIKTMAKAHMKKRGIVYDKKEKRVLCNLVLNMLIKVRKELNNTAIRCDRKLITPAVSDLTIQTWFPPEVVQAVLVNKH